MRAGVQAILRDRLYQLNRVCQEHGNVREEDLENFENLYRQYHALGANGVMDKIRADFMRLPIKK